MKRISPTAAWCVAILGSLLALYSLYATLFFGWLTATPLTPEQLKRAQFDTQAWFLILILSMVGTLIAVVWLWRRRQKA